MNGINKFFNLHNIYLILVIYFIYSCVTGENFFEMDTAEFMDRYFGISQYLIMAVLVANYLLSYVKNEKKKLIFTLINYFLYVGFISLVILWMYYKLGLFGKIGGSHLEYDFVKLTVFQYKLGLIPSYFTSLIILAENDKIFYGGLGISLLNALLLLIMGTNWIFINNYRKIRKGYIQRKKIEEEEALLKEKIAIKESVERNELEQIRRMNIEAEKRIREEVTTNNPIKDEYDIDEIRSTIQNELSKRKKKDGDKNDTGL